MHYLILFIFALAPSTIWLLFFLRKDSRPEPSGEIIKIFSYGALIALPAVLIELGLFKELHELRAFFSQYFLFSASLTLFGGAILLSLVEEFLKYLVVREEVLKSPEFDEPIDVMLYMIIAALGFAAFENVLILFSSTPILVIKDALALSAFRFVGATLLHALCSGLIGYFLALSFFEPKKRKWFFFWGLGIAALLHALYNFSIITTGGNTRFITPGIILIVLISVILLGLKNLKKMTSICLPDLPKARVQKGKIK